MIDSKITHETGEQWNKQEGQKLIDLFFWDGIFIDPAYLLGKHSYPRTLFLSRVEKRLDRSWLIKCGSNFTISVLLNFRAEIFCLRSNPVKTRFSHVSCGLKIHHQILKGWCAVLNFTTSMHDPILPSRFMKMIRWTKLILLKLLKAAGCKMVWKRSPPLSRFAGWVPVLLNNSTSSLAYEEMVQILQLEFAVLRFFGFSHRIHFN